jgi:hypothetical protein
LIRSSNDELKGGFLASTREPEVSFTQQGLFPQQTTELDYDLGIAGNSNIQGQQVASGKRKVFITVRVFLLYM